jgi:hypothetical protein
MTIPNITEHHILNLGAGVQSTALYLMFCRKQITPQIDCAIFADTQDEPGAEQRRLGLPDPEGSVYSHLDWLVAHDWTKESVPPIMVRTKGKLSADLMRGENSTGQRFASIPAYTLRPDGTEGKTRRQCSMEYKIEVINRVIRREVLGLKPGRAVPACMADAGERARGIVGRVASSVVVHQYIGISADEADRAVRVMRNGVAKNLKREAKKWGYSQLQEYFSVRNWRFHFPFVEHGVTRQDCEDYLKPLVPHKTPRSACTFCPFHNDIEWDRLKREDPIGFARAVEVDHALRIPGNIVNRNMDQPMFLHRSCKPLDLVQFDLTPKGKTQAGLFGASKFAQECLGVCGV